MGPEGRFDAERLRRLLGAPELKWLLLRMRWRLEHGRTLQGTVTLADPTPAQRLAAQRLLGRAPRAGRALGVSLDALDEVVRRTGASPEGLACAVLAITGPVVVRQEALQARHRAWERAFAPLSAVVEQRSLSSGEGAQALAGWLERLRRYGAVKRMQGDPALAGELLERLAAVLAALPAEGEPLGAFAARVAGGAHALDDGQPLGTLALGAARTLAGVGAPRSDESPAESRREVWAAVGLLCDELSSAVLTLSLPGEERTGSGRILATAGGDGQPIWLTLRQLVRDPPAWAHSAGGGLAGRTVHICENPVVVAFAADRLGGGCGPLVCTSGQPGAATMVLLRALAGAGARLVHHGDFDWGGVRIGNALHARLAVRPWRFDAQTYVRLAREASCSQRLGGPPVPAAWDPPLTEAMRRVGRRVEEESVVEDLLADLAARHLE